ncbi:RDR1 [Hepatospora eriocheir]|uniref:RDR1 n=1 Tax=Hepatospora eriocheir TaxID=1081669 RepID=A0A1X0QHW2_9MICR|nr:RDR1 [Hepatospora eriocheir]
MNEFNKKAIKIFIDENKQLISKTEYKIDCVIINAECPSGVCNMASLISETINLPVCIPYMISYSINSYKSTNIEIGDLVSFNSFSHFKESKSDNDLINKRRKVDNENLITFHLKSIIYYYEKYKIIINSEDIELILINIISDSLKIYFGLKYKPKVFQTDSILYFEENYLNRIIWTRCSNNEYKDFNDNNDICIIIPLLLNGNSVIHYNQGYLINIISILYRFNINIYYNTVNNIDSFCSRELDDFLTFIEKNYTFDEYYNMKCLISRKRRYMHGLFDKNVFEFIKEERKGNPDFIKNLCKILDSNLKKRFESVNVYNLIKSVTYNKKKFHNLSRSMSITPLNIVYNYEQSIETNRILRYFDNDKFIRVSFRDENLTSKYKNDDTINNDCVYDYFRSIMLNGIFIGNRKYFFLIMTNSQMHEHTAWFVSIYYDYKLDRLVGADYIKDWLGEFKNIKVMGKYAVRIAQFFSSTTPTIDVEKYITIPDIEKNGYCYTDGIGLCNGKIMYEVKNKLKLNFLPSALQIRFAGCKGVIVYHSFLDDINENNKELKDWLIRNDLKFNNLIFNSKLNPNELVSDKLSNDESKNFIDLIVRSSMNKFNSSHRNLEVCRPAKSNEFFLNRQIIMILEGLGIPKEVFIKLQDIYILDVIKEVTEDPNSFIAKHSPYFKKNSISLEFSFFRKLLVSIINNIFDDLNKKSRIKVSEGRSAIGVTDELAILEEDEIFLMYKDYFKYVVAEGIAILAKNPCVHPGDIRVVKCVDRKELYYLKEVVVFSQKGDRPLFNQASGSDLDGDIYSVSWNKDLIPNHIFKPYDYSSKAAVLTKETVLFSDIVNFFIRHMRYYQLGSIANSHLSMADQTSIFSEDTLKLAELFNKSIDFIKTGSSATVPEDLLPKEYPDFMEKPPQYLSDKAIGYLYRRSRFYIKSNSFCECINCFNYILKDLDIYKKILLKGANIVIKTIRPLKKRSEEIEFIKSSYKHDIKSLMSRNNLWSEEDLFVNNEEGVGKELRNILFKYRKLLKNVNGSDLLNNSCKDRIESMPFIFDCQNDLFNCFEQKLLNNSNFQLLDNNSELDQIMNTEDNNNSLILNNTINTCPFNNNLYIENLVDDSDVDLSSIVKIVNNNQIVIKANYSKIINLLDRLDENRFSVFKELFNLLLLSDVYRVSEIDRIINLLEYINNNIIDHSNLYVEVAKICFGLGDDRLFKIGFVLSLDYSLFRKLNFLYNKELLNVSKYGKSKRFYRNDIMVVNGMLDENDDIKFIKLDDNAYHIQLNNKGYCEKSYYKDDVRNALINILYSLEDNSRTLIELYLKGGVFKVKYIDTKLENSKVTIRYLLNNYLTVDEKYYEFVNLKTNKMLNFYEEKIVHISFFFEGSNYLLEYSFEDGKIVLEYLYKNVKRIGKVCIINNNNGFDRDYLIEMYSKVLLCNGDSNWCTKDELFIIKSGFFDYENMKVNTDKYLLNLEIKEKIIKRSNDDYYESNGNYYGMRNWMGLKHSLFDENFNILWTKYENNEI